MSFHSTETAERSRVFHWTKSVYECGPIFSVQFSACGEVLNPFNYHTITVQCGMCVYRYGHCHRLGARLELELLMPRARTVHTKPLAIPRTSFNKSPFQNK